MKKLTTLILASLLILGACKKDKAPAKTFADYTRTDILKEAADIVSEQLSSDASAATNFKAGSVILFKTTYGNYGKLEVLNIAANFDLTLNITVFNSDGSILLKKTFIVLPLDNGYYDLDDPSMPIINSDDADFAWTNVQGVHVLYFLHGAKGFLCKL